MNQEVRKFLIDQCVKGEPIYYKAIGQMLGLNLSLDSDRHILSKTLGKISAAEKRQIECSNQINRLNLTKKIF